MNVNDSQMTQSEIGVLPADWSIRRVDSLFDIQQGKSVSKAHRKGDNQKSFLRTKNIFWGNIDLTELDQMHFTVAEEDRLKLQTGDLLLCEGGDVGRTAVWNDQAEGCYYQNHLHRLRAKVASEVDPQFALYWFWYAFEIADIYIGRSNITTIPNLSQSKLSELQIPKPKFAEQHRIAYVLNTLQTIIGQQARQIALICEFKSALMYKLFSEGLRGEKQKETEIGLVPESWEVVKVLQAYKFTDIRKGSKLPHPIPFIPMELIPVGQKEIVNFETREKATSGTYVENGDLLIAKITPSFENGKQGILKIPFANALATTEVIPIKAIEGKSDLLYLHYFLLKSDIRSAMAGKMEGTTGRQRLSKTVVGEQLLPLPKITEQEEISQMLSSFDDKILITQRKIEKSKELFRTLLHHLMTGQMRVNESDLPGLLLGDAHA